MKVWKIVAAVVVVAVAGVIVFLLTFDIGTYKGQIEAQLKATTGRDVAIGEIRLGLSLAPTLVLENVSVANASWGSRPQMIAAKKIAARAELMPLLGKHVIITKVALDGADVLLETDKQGQANWDFSAAQKQSGGAGGDQQSDVTIGAIEGSDFKVSIKDGKTGDSSDITVKAMTLRLDGALQQVAVASLTIDDATVHRSQGPDTLQASIGKFALESSGPVKDFGFRKVEASDIKVSGTSAGAPMNVEVSKISLNQQGAVDFEAKYNGGTVRATGTIAALTALKSGQKALPAKLSLEGMGLKGDVDLVVDGATTPPTIKGTVNVPEFDMAKLVSVQGAPAKSEPAKSVPAKTEPKTGGMFSNAPLPWDSLQGINADVKFTAAKVKLTNGQILTNVSLPIKLDRGHLLVNGAVFDMAGGKVEGTLDANAGAKTVAIKGNVKGMTAEGVAKAYKLGDVVANGPLDVAVDLHGSGVSLRAISANLNGSFLAGMGEGRISNEGLKKIGMGGVLQLLSALNPAGGKETSIVAHCAVANFQIANGVATTQNGVALMSDKLQVVGSGKIDLGQERIDMTLKPTVGGAVGASLGTLVSAVKVTGPLNSPSVGLDAASTAKTVGGLAVTISGGALIGVAAAGGSKLFGGGKNKTENKDGGASNAANICTAARASAHH